MGPLMSRRMFVKAVAVSAGAVSVPSFVEAARLMRLPSRIEVLSYGRVVAVAAVTPDQVDRFLGDGQPIEVAIEVDAAMEAEGARAVFDGGVHLEGQFTDGARRLQPGDLLTVTMSPA